MSRTHFDIATTIELKRLVQFIRNFLNEFIFFQSANRRSVLMFLQWYDKFGRQAERIRIKPDSFLTTADLRYRCPSVHAVTEANGSLIPSERATRRLQFLETVTADIMSDWLPRIGRQSGPANDAARSLVARGRSATDHPPPRARPLARRLPAKCLRHLAAAAVLLPLADGSGKKGRANARWLAGPRRRRLPAHRPIGLLSLVRWRSGQFRSSNRHDNKQELDVTRDNCNPTDARTDRPTDSLRPKNNEPTFTDPSRSSSVDCRRCLTGEYWVVKRLTFERPPIDLSDNVPDWRHANGNRPETNLTQPASFNLIATDVGRRTGRGLNSDAL